MKRTLIVASLAVSALIYGIVTFVLPSVAGDKAPAAAKTASANDAGYRVGDRLPVATPKQNGATQSPAPFEEVSWFALVPNGWDPMKKFNEDMSKYSDADPRAMAALDKLREEWDNAPAEPSMQGARIRIAGFAVPLDGERGQLKEFLLVPYFGACIHTPPPPANQIIHVFVKKPLKDVQVMDAVWVSGVLEIARSRSADNTMGLAGSVGYQMQAEVVTPYKGK